MGLGGEVEGKAEIQRIVVLPLLYKLLEVTKIKVVTNKYGNTGSLSQGGTHIPTEGQR